MAHSYQQIINEIHHIKTAITQIILNPNYCFAFRPNTFGPFMNLPSSSANLFYYLNAINRALQKHDRDALIEIIRWWHSNPDIKYFHGAYNRQMPTINYRTHATL